MTLEMAVTLAILAAAALFFITDWLRVDVVALCVVIALMATGILTVEEALAGFSSPVVMSIAALFIVGGAVFQTGLAATIGDHILRAAGTNESRLLLVFMVSIAVLSAFISSTGVVALMLPAVMSLSTKSKISASKLLMPLAFSSLLGGALTLIGTPPNIIVSDILLNAGYAPFHFFSFTPVGSLLLICGIGFMFTVGRRLLPERKAQHTVQQMETPAELFELYRLPDNLFRLRVHDESKLNGLKISALGLRDDFDVNIVNVQREDKTVHPAADMILQTDDVIVVQGKGNDVGRAAALWGLAIMANQPVREGDMITNEVGIAEVLLRPRSALLGQTLSDVRFGSTYHLTVLNIYRPGVSEKLDIKTTPLKFGDMLLVQGEWKNIFALKRFRHDFIVMGEPEAAQMGVFSRRSYASTTLIILLLMMLAIMFSIASLTLASLTAAVALVISGCLKMDEAYESIDWKSLVLIAGLLPMSTALVKVGLVNVIAETLAVSLGQMGPFVVLASLFLLTGLLTQILSNTATALLIAPIALNTAQSLNIDPHAFLMAVAVAASMAFITPIASPVNTLVMTPGNYKFSDYVRVGSLLFGIAFIVVIITLPILFPF